MKFYFFENLYNTIELRYWHINDLLHPICQNVFTYLVILYILYKLSFVYQICQDANPETQKAKKTQEYNNVLYRKTGTIRESV